MNDTRMERPRADIRTIERSLIQSHCVGAEWPSYLAEIDLGESVIVQTERFNAVNGPLHVRGIAAGDAIAVHIDAIDILPPFESPNGGPLDGLPMVPLELRDGVFLYPNGFRLPAAPSVGNVAVLPEPDAAWLAFCRDAQTEYGDRGWRRALNDTRGKHCHQDCGALAAGATIHLRANVDGAGLCISDVHGYIGQGELAFAGIEVAADVSLRVTRSQDWLVDWPLIETADEVMVVCGWSDCHPELPAPRFVDLVRLAFRELRRVVAHHAGCSEQEANALVAAAADLRNCALYGLGQGYLPGTDDQPPFDLAVAAALPKRCLES